ncbi:MAG: N-acetyltransferase [Bacteroidetes bacterium]|jgi:UDP-2-acetamido-3-amino-2,3-dideoxy-glucuronate N-acetyltransferase|nr:N-acetyltransferase [Bacteroidota bacterium]
MKEEIYIHETAIVEDGCILGAGTKVWHFSHIMGSAIIGSKCNIGQNVFIADGVIIGNNNKVQNNVSIYSGVECEDDVFLGPSMVFTNVINPRSAVNRKEEYKRTLIKKGASIGANATIICGVEIGCYAMIGAGAVVTKDVKDFELLVGNPAKRIGWVSEYGNKLKFDENGIALCKETSSKYLLEDGKVIKVN